MRDESDRICCSSPWGWKADLPQTITQRDLEWLIQTIELRRKHMNISFDCFIETLRQTAGPLAEMNTRSEAKGDA